MDDSTITYQSATQVSLSDEDVYQKRMEMISRKEPNNKHSTDTEQEITNNPIPAWRKQSKNVSFHCSVDEKLLNVSQWVIW